MSKISHNNQQPKVAIVTGASSGIGQQVVQLLSKQGWQVFGTVRNANTTAPIAGVKLMSMDVTDSGSVNLAIQAVLHESGRIDALVNNAGYALVGAVEETSIEEAQQQFDTNFFGVMRTTQAILPIMRRQHSGRIINISSVVGFLPSPYMGIYSASKHALEGYTETLDHEVRGFGVRAILIEPPYTKTALGAKSKIAAIALDEYAHQRKRATATTQSKMEQAPGPEAVADAVYRAITSPRPRLRYPVGEGIFLSRLRHFAPASLFDRGIRSQFQLDG